MEKILNKINNDLDNLALISPDEVETIRLFKQTLEHASKLDLRTRNLINVALTISTQPAGCFDRILKEAMQDGISQSEILGAACLALIQLNGAATTIIKPLMEAINKNNLESFRSDCYWLDVS